VAQKFTVDPRLLAAVTGGASRIEDDDDTSLSVGSDTDDDESVTKPIIETKKEKMDRLVREYEESVKAAAEEGCLMCGS
jgi:hypothetical protein